MPVARLAVATMRSLSLSIAVVVALGGCATTGGKITAGVGGVFAIGAVVSASQAGCGDRDKAFPCVAGIAQTAALTSVAVVAFAIAGVIEILGAPALPADAPRQRDPRLAELTREAYAAARIGRCDNVGWLGAQVRTIDADYYERVFAVDIAIAHCL